MMASAKAQSASFTLGAAACLEGPSSGIGSVVLAATPSTATWSATNNATWLHLNAANQNGTGSTNVIFSYDANPGATRAGTIRIAGQTFTVNQAGSTYVATADVTALAVPGSSDGIAVDGEGNVYMADYNYNDVLKWTLTNNSVSTVISSGVLGTPGAIVPISVAVDAVGDVYYADYDASLIVEVSAANRSVTAIVSSGLLDPGGVAVDGTGNIYIADTGHNEVKKWSATDNAVTTLVSSGLNDPTAVALDTAGNVYIADTDNIAIKEWNAADDTVTLLTSSGFWYPYGVAVDTAGNVYIADTFSNAIKEWTVANDTVVTLVSNGLSYPMGVAVDGAGNVYFNDGVVFELPRAFVDPTPRSYSCAPGSDALPVVLPTNANLLPPFAPSSDAPWLTITGVTNGVVSFTLATNSGPIRGAYITLLGQPIEVLQASPPNFLNPTAFSNSTFQFAFSNFQNSSFTVLSTTNLMLPVSSWTLVGTASNIAPDYYQFTDTQASGPQRFYRVRSP